MTSLSACRGCGGAIFPAALLAFKDMPKAAQNFPDASAVHLDLGEDVIVRQCAACGLVQLEGEPVSYFREVIRAAGISDVLREHKTSQLRRFIDDHALAGRKVLEVGCGRGEFLSLLGPLGVDAHGIEYGDAAVEECRSAGLHVSKAYLEPGVHLHEGPFDAFFILMFLEHMPDPRGALAALHHNLKPGAVGLVEVPNFDMMLRRSLFAEFIADHLLYFTRDTLLATLCVNGFEVLECDEQRDEYVLSATVRRRRPTDLSSFRSAQAGVKQEIENFIAQVTSGRVAIWGAGHQALAMIALTGIADAITYVVDGASFKQGKLTPATHLPIVAPTRLRQDPVDAVIVMCGSYSDEVAGILRRDFDPRLRLAILRPEGLELVGGRDDQSDKNRRNR